MASLKIDRVETFLTQPGGSRLIIVKVSTSEPGLYGLGCATYTQRHRAVQTALDKHIGPFVIGKDPANSEDLWQSAMVNGYWRNGPVLNNAISGVDMALWDIKGKLASMPCYQLWGGQCRGGAAVYTHADGRDAAEVADHARRFIAEGYHYVRCQLGGYPGLDAADRRPDGAFPGAYFDPREKLRAIPRLFEALRAELPEDIELLHDVHERLAPIDAVWLAKALEPYRLFFVEDLLAPEDIDWFQQIRAVCATPIAMGELFNNPREITPLIAGRLIDFIRVHLSQIGGVTPALKLAHCCEAFGVRTAWHGPGDVSPVGMAANVHLDVACINFGIQEWALRSEAECAIFPGLPEVRNGYAYPNDRPGWGIEFDEKRAAEFPCTDENPDWTVSRLPDGTLWRP
ncbi:MAG TPA: enolase C-terminal domain-like protein [Candidatus Hydrogenedentes bacterium]|nr:enolase C-terminal domain-like protein [Candidatus Hydrogenedentota bacterium]HPG65248.1 enolase C-terminal domain-like protein [Candidatus Hydrogenedentota bacterium]